MSIEPPLRDVVKGRFVLSFLRYAMLLSLRALTSSLVFLLSGLMAASAHAQELEELEPPTPIHEREPVQTPAEDARPRSTPRKERLGPLAITPSAAFALQLNLTNDRESMAAMGLWLGFNAYPSPSTHSLLLSGGIKIERHFNLYGDPIDVIPTLRVGYAWIKGNPELFKRRLLPRLQVYGIAGVRFGGERRERRYRGGIGAGVPMWLPASAYMCLHGLPIPNIVELIVEPALEEESGPLNVLFMIGIGL